MTSAAKLHMRAIARRAKVIVSAQELQYASSLRALFRGLHDAYVTTLVTHRKLRTGFVDTFGDDPLGWMTLGTAGAAIEVHFTTQAAHKVGAAFDRMAPRLQRVTREIATLQGISPVDQGIADVAATARNANIELVEKAARDYAADVRAVFEDPENYDLAPSALRELLVARGNASIARADLIARDQVLKFAGQMNKIRQLNAGVEEYTWSGVMDVRERPSHVALEGNRYKWGESTPIGYEPGQDYQCRCIAIAWVSELADL